MLVEGIRERASKCQMSKCLGQTNSGTAFSPKAPYLPRRVDQVSPFRLDCDITSRHVHVRLPALAIPIFTISADRSATFTESCRWTRAAPTTSLSPPACKFVCYCCAQSSAFLPHVLLGCHCCLAIETRPGSGWRERFPTESTWYYCSSTRIHHSGVVFGFTRTRGRIQRFTDSTGVCPGG